MHDTWDTAYYRMKRTDSRDDACGFVGCQLLQYQVEVAPVDDVAEEHNNDVHSVVAEELAAIDHTEGQALDAVEDESEVPCVYPLVAAERLLDDVQQLCHFDLVGNILVLNYRRKVGCVLVARSATGSAEDKRNKVQ